MYFSAEKYIKIRIVWRFFMNSEKRLMQAIKCLLDKHPIEKITINMILEESDLSKSTFYKYYSDKYDLAVSYYNYVIKT